MGNVICVKGVSGSGKSTRTFLLFKFFEDNGFKIEDFYITNFENKSKFIGQIVKDLNLIFIGKKYETGKLTRFQGYDVMTGVFGKSSYLSDFLKENSDKYSFLIEGAGVTGTNRLRPLFLNEFCGFNNILVQYYNYNLEQKEQYLERIFLRSGKLPTKGAMWDKYSGFISDHRYSLKELKQLEDKGIDISNMFTFYNLYDTPEYDLGVKVLEFFDLGDLSENFIEYCKNSNYISLNNFENFENGK